MSHKTIHLRLVLAMFALVLATSLFANATTRERTLIDDGWQFALGNASSPQLDFGCGTEYFNYLTKANSIHNEGPYSLKFDPSKWDAKWTVVDLPHDWVVDLPFAPEASHSHGYKTVGYRYPENSVGWYRRMFSVDEADRDKHVWLEFEGIFRDARVWVNGFYLGHEPSGYATQIYDITDYLNYGGENLVCVRCDATLEEGWFYEGAGIYRHVWLNKAAKLHVAPFGTSVTASFDNDDFSKARIFVETTVANSSLDTISSYSLRHTIIDAAGNPVKTVSQAAQGAILPMSQMTTAIEPVCLTGDDLHLWSTDSPYLYQLMTEVVTTSGDVIDSYSTSFGVRDVSFSPDNGFLLNGKSVKLRGVNMHQDHAGVGAGIPDALNLWRLRQLKKMGVNAYRASHNPMSPAVLNQCDSLGILVIEENRLTGVNTEHIGLLERMIVRDRNHPSIILWSVGNEEWGIEWDERGERIAATMRAHCHLIDPTRPMTVATSGGPVIVIPADVAGYNYILQNPVDQHRADYPQRCALGSEETSGCGTRGIYFNDSTCLVRRFAAPTLLDADGGSLPNETAVMKPGRMPALNRQPTGPDSLLNAIERGMQFYNARPWLAGHFYWTGFDYRGEPNPLVYPATGSQFGILDYCGFPKDEAYFLRACWTDEPVLHILPHWNLDGMEGQSVDVWVYSNCDEVEMRINGRSLGRKPMPADGHLAWEAAYKPGRIEAIGYRDGHRIATERVETAGPAAAIKASADRTLIDADGRDLAVVTIEMRDSKGRFAPTANVRLSLTVDGPAKIVGVGNGDSAWLSAERPDANSDGRSFAVTTFNGRAQVLLGSIASDAGTATLTIAADGLTSASVRLTTIP